MSLIRVFLRVLLRFFHTGTNVRPPKNPFRIQINYKQPSNWIVTVYKFSIRRNICIFTIIDNSASYLIFIFRGNSVHPASTFERSIAEIHDYRILPCLFETGESDHIVVDVLGAKTEKQGS